MKRKPNDRLQLPRSNGATALERLAPELCRTLYRVMVRSRAMEERMIKMSKSGEGFFWIGGPGEEAFNTCLGLQIKKGQGADYDYLHLHYRNAATMIAMGGSMLDCVRQMAMVATDPHSRGRNFAAHYAKKEWNVVPVCSVIGIQWSKAPGTALVQKRRGGDGVTVAVGGDAGTAEGDFQSCLIWSTRPGRELPILMIVMNNGWGISTSHASQHRARSAISRAEPFGIPGEVVDGNDPIASWFALERAFKYVRTRRAPFILEARVSRLYGHSSSSGAPRHKEPDCVAMFEEALIEQETLDHKQIQQIRGDAEREIDEAVLQAVREPKPTVADIDRDVYAASPVDLAYPEDYTGLPFAVDQF